MSGPNKKDELFHGEDKVSAVSVTDLGEDYRSTESKIAFVSEPWRNMAAFWIAGLINNAAYVIMNAGAKHISAGGVGLVYTANILPTLIVKLTLPYWYHLVGYKARMICFSVLTTISLLMVGLASDDMLAVKLVGVAFSAAASGIGEASFLGYATRYNSKQVLTMWASGTGFAGIFGYAWNEFWLQAVKLDFNGVCLTGLIMPVLYLAVVFFMFVESPNKDIVEQRKEEQERIQRNSNIIDGKDLPFAQKMKFIVTRLWIYMIPLFLVYFSEYAMQAGTWAAIGVPRMESTANRNNFYFWAGWSYQAGVFISRSSGTIPLVKSIRSIKMLWLMPILQTLFVIFFSLDVIYQFWIDWGLMFPCFVTGLLGGFVYVFAFLLISDRIEPNMVEFSLTASSVGDTFGILLSDIVGIFLQGCLYAANDTVDCTQDSAGVITCSAPTYTCGHSFNTTANPAFL